MQLPPDDPQVDADPVRLAQIISNLLTNAAKYTDPHGTIRLSVLCDGSTAVLSVADNGIGIAEAELPNIFHMFSQVTSAQERSEGGLGIGLALTKGLVELHGGKVEVSSEGLGQGSTFSVSLPIICAAATATAHGASERPLRPDSTSSVLVADDNRDAADSLALLLRELGHHVIVAADGAAAYEAYLTHRPDVLLLDIGMPKLSGYEIAKRVRAEGKGPLLIAVTGWGQESDRAKAIAAGFDHHLTKPVDYDGLTRLLQQVQTRQIA